MSTAIWSGILTVVGVIVGVPLATLIKGKLDERLKRLELADKKDESDREEEDEDKQRLRTELADAKQEARVSREDADRERTARLAEADAHLRRSAQILADVEAANTNVQRLLRQASEERQAHAAEMEAQRQAHDIQMKQTRLENQRVLQDHIERIEELEGWIVAGKPPPPPPWVRS